LRYQQAVGDFKALLALEPQNETVRGQMVATQKLMRKIEFEKLSFEKNSPSRKLISIGLFRLLNGKGRRTPWTDAERLLLKVVRL
jgi:hypothetical protein